jgi:hypothetical protein
MNQSGRRSPARSARTDRGAELILAIVGFVWVRASAKSGSTDGRVTSIRGWA